MSKHTTDPWILQILRWWYRKTIEINGGQDATERHTGSTTSLVKYEINVSRAGSHVFATDSTIRNYSSQDIEGMVKLFRVAFPECKIEVTAFSHRNSVALPENLR